MRVALLQYPIVWTDISANLFQTQSRLAAIAGKADVALLPEMFTTGFCVRRPELAESVNGKTLTCLKRWAKDYDIAIAGSFMAKENGCFFNRGFFVRPDGTTDFVDKRHLYATGGEADFFTAGERRVISEYKGVRFCLQICYDLRFPVWTRNKSGNDYDILLYSALWPDVRIAAWDVLVPARGIENQCYVAGVNCVGNDGIGLHYNGHSVAYDTRLNRLVSFDDDEEGTKIADFNVEKLRYFREVLPLWKDNDGFEFTTVH
ncbi:MAG: nitrilase family protein [Paludibacteraceae bacterium]|nr:nitrilase family protein [Paludibacteraceae bacterium]